MIAALWPVVVRLDVVVSKVSGALTTMEHRG